ncbi:MULTISPECIES: PTS sugar transporter subunit IIA [Morganellaceae]|uniref:PTS sugar transporter subunit IIA n=1 Tax=Morganellaceae TaxID=1903414 RepID=UPI0018E460DE|nr:MULTISPECIES: PTS sugar transporter subunit IIA [Morganellaceae]MBI6529973.1 PTS sugar transporter subunit IIA [Proteus vulgaris]MBP6082202.1 PTS sugar transporter subunit IIA [Providencia sp.]
MIFKILVNDVEEAIDDWSAAIQFAGQKLLEKDYITPEYIQACLIREKSYPTGLLMVNGQGIAIPHADYSLVKINSISIVRFDKNVVFGQMEDADLTVECSIMFNLAFATSDQHMSVLRRLFTLFQDISFIESCRNLKTHEVGKYVEEMLSAS